jgi:hypothetical protein
MHDMIVSKITTLNILSWVFEFETCVLRKVKANQSKMGKKSQKFISSLKSIIGAVDNIETWDTMQFDEMHVSKKYTIKRNILNDMRRECAKPMPEPWLINFWDMAIKFRQLKRSEPLPQQLIDHMRFCIAVYIDDVYKKQSRSNKFRTYDNTEEL